MRTFMLVFLLTFSVFVSAGSDGPDLAALLAGYEEEQADQEENTSGENIAEGDSEARDEGLVEVVDSDQVNVPAEVEVLDPISSGDLLSDEELSLGEALEEISAPLEVGVPIHQVTDEVIENTAKKISSLTDQDLVNSSVVIDGRLVTLLSLGGVHKHVHALTQSILTRLYSDNDHSEVEVHFNSSPVPKVDISSWDENARKIEAYKELRERYYVRGNSSMKPVEIARFRKLEEEVTQMLAFALRPQPETGYQSRRKTTTPKKKVRGRPKEPEGRVTPEQMQKYRTRLARWEEAKAKRDAEERAAAEEEEFQRKIRTRLRCQ